MSALSRRSLVASAAALPALAVPAAACASVEPDPIFAVIAAYGPAFDQWEAALRAADFSPDARKKLPRGEYRRLKMEEDILRDEFEEIENKLFSTVPTTLAGLSALFAYIRTHEQLNEDWRHHNFHILAATQVERALCRLQGLPEPPAWEEEEGRLTPANQSA